MWLGHSRMAGRETNATLQWRRVNRDAGLVGVHGFTMFDREEHRGKGTGGQYLANITIPLRPYSRTNKKNICLKIFLGDKLTKNQEQEIPREKNDLHE